MKIMEETTMAINFTTNITEYTNIHRTAKAKQFMEFGSKKQLQDADVLTDKELKFVTSIKGTFGFALHNDGRYMAVTLYRANAEKKYNFLVLDLQAQAVAEVGSIKEAKSAILELIEEAEAPAEDVAPAEETTDELAGVVKGLLDEALSEQNADDTDKKSKKNSKTA
jgi:hypothetical protein